MNVFSKFLPFPRALRLLWSSPRQTDYDFVCVGTGGGLSLYVDRHQTQGRGHRFQVRDDGGRINNGCEGWIDPDGSSEPWGTSSLMIDRFRGACDDGTKVSLERFLGYHGFFRSVALYGEDETGWAMLGGWREKGFPHIRGRALQARPSSSLPTERETEPADRRVPAGRVPWAVML